MGAETAIAISFGAVMAVFSFSLVYYTFMRVRQYGGFESNSFVTVSYTHLTLPTKA